MLMPSIFGENLFDDFMDFPFDRDFFRGTGRSPLYGKNEKNLMKTDVKETDTAYEVDIDLPGFKKEDVNASLENGYLTINAVKGLNKDEKEENGKYIRRERYTGQCSRSFYVGDAVTQEDIKAKFEDGILKLTIPKKDPNEIKQNKYIAIEG
ncbi:MAG: Hsp20/alpha crystallin family protein [Lachnospiraceae bacterium]|nr:Hsp20/alpha crystallin family protein [Lachnospiraceae bacterium]